MKNISLRICFFVTILTTLLFGPSQASLAGSSLLQEYLPQSPCSPYKEHKYFGFCYQKNHRLSAWTVHWLDRDMLEQGRTRRTNDYRSDPSISRSVSGDDYARTGFDRGHLVPAADMRLNYQAMSESFFMTNITPQRPGFNRGIWRSLENHVRRSITKWGRAYIVTGALLLPGLPQLKDGISIPQDFYKILYWPALKRMEAYLIPNNSQPNKDVEDFLISVDEIELKSGIDFFSQLPDSLEDYLESQNL